MEPTIASVSDPAGFRKAIRRYWRFVLLGPETLHTDNQGYPCVESSYTRIVLVIRV